MALQGNLKDFNLVQLLNLINLTRKSGKLAIERNKQEANLYFQDGRLLFASVPGHTQPLDQVLLQAGKITPDQARDVTQAGDTTDKGLAVRLVDFGYMSQDDILQQLRNRAIETVYSLFTWQEGPFRFESNITLPGEFIAVPIRLESIIIEGSRRAQEWEKLNQQVPDLNVVVRTTSQPTGSQTRQINLTFDEWLLIPMVSDGRHTIQEIARHHNMDDYKIRKIMYRLIAAGLVEVVKTSEPRKASGFLAPFMRDPAVQKPQQRKNLVLRLIDRIRGI